MTYVDGFVLPLPTTKIEEYRAMADKAGKLWIEHGALAYKECVGEDLADKEYCTSFPTMVRTSPEETVVFAFIVFRDRAHRDEVNAKVMADPRLCEAGDPNNMPFDCKRMIYGGFRTIVEHS